MGGKADHAHFWLFSDGMEVQKRWCTVGAKKIMAPQINLKAHEKFKYRAMDPVSTGETK